MVNMNTCLALPLSVQIIHVFSIFKFRTKILTLKMMTLIANVSYEYYFHKM